MLWLNTFPVQSGVSAVYSPQELLVRWRMDYKKHCHVVPSTYCKVHDEPLLSNMMMARTHEAIAMRPTGNLQGSNMFFCLKTGQILKRHSFMPMPMPDRVIRCVNAIKAREKQGCNFCFLNRLREPYKWTDEVLEDHPKFQGLLDEEEAPYPNLSAELPKPELKLDEIDDAPAITEDDTPAFEELAAHALDNAGINPQDYLQAAQNLPKWNEAPDSGPVIVNAHEEKNVYEITSDLPDAGLVNNIVPPDNNVPKAGPNVALSLSDVPAVGNKEVNKPSCYPTQYCWIALGHQPYNEQAPCIVFIHQGEEEEEQQVAFLQLGDTRVHRSVLDKGRFAKMTKEERMHMTTCSGTDVIVDDADHTVDPSPVTTCGAELKM